MNGYVKPPLGVSPHWYIHNKRITELSQGITRYSEFIAKNNCIIDAVDYYGIIEQWAKEIVMLAHTEKELHTADRK